MQESEFLKQCERDLAQLAAEIEKRDKNSTLEIDFDGEVLEINIMATNQTYVINKHSASRKIWYSSPLSGADYFVYKNNQWLSDKGEEISAKLLNELKL